MQSKPYDVVLIPAKNISEQAIHTSVSIKHLGVYFTLDIATYFPHISIYMLQLNKQGLAKSLELLAKIANNTNLITIHANHYNYENNYIDIEYTPTKEIKNLQTEVVEVLNPIRDGLREKEATRIASTTGDYRKNLERYGYRYIGDRFSPHLTFTRFTKNQKQVLDLMPRKETWDGVYPTLGLFEMGDNGTCIHKVKTWNLEGG
jgi:hypothetical protein